MLIRLDVRTTTRRTCGTRSRLTPAVWSTWRGAIVVVLVLLFGASSASASRREAKTGKAKTDKPARSISGPTRGRRLQVPIAGAVAPKLYIEEHRSARLSKLLAVAKNLDLSARQAELLLPEKVAAKRRPWREAGGPPSLVAVNARLRPFGYRFAREPAPNDPTSKDWVLYRGNKSVARFGWIEGFRLSQDRRHFSFAGPPSSGLESQFCIDGRLSSRERGPSAPIWIDNEPWRLQAEPGASRLTLVRGFPGKTKIVRTFGTSSPGNLRAVGRGWAVEAEERIYLDGKRVARRGARSRSTPSLFVLAGRPFYFFATGNRGPRAVGISYDGKKQSVFFDEVIGRVEANPWMVYFLARRRKRFYYVEAGLFGRRPPSVARKAKSRPRPARARLTRRWKSSATSLVVEEYSVPVLDEFTGLDHAQVMALLPPFIARRRRKWRQPYGSHAKGSAGTMKAYEVREISAEGGAAPRPSTAAPWGYRKIAQAPYPKGEHGPGFTFYALVRGKIGPRFFRKLEAKLKRDPGYARFHQRLFKNRPANPIIRPPWSPPQLVAIFAVAFMPAGYNPLWVFAYPGGWAVESTESIVVNGKMVAAREGYSQWFYLIDGKPFHFLQKTLGKGTEVGFAYAGETTPLHYNEVGGEYLGGPGGGPMIWQNDDMVWFVAKRGGHHYYVEAGVYDSKATARPPRNKRDGAGLAQRLLPDAGATLGREPRDPRRGRVKGDGLANKERPSRWACGCTGSPGRGAGSAAFLAFLLLLLGRPRRDG